MRSQRCLLFVPGSRPERFAKAVTTGADMVCIDLEDAVLLDEKESARNSVIAYFEEIQKERSSPNNGMGKKRLGVRINCLSHLDGLKDIIAISDSSFKPDFIMLPKVSHPKEMQILSSLVENQSIDLIALIESPEGIRNSVAIAKSTSSLKAIMLGGADLSVELGCEMDWDGLLFSRGLLVSAGAEANVAVIDVPFLDIKNDDGLNGETSRIKNLGFTAKSAIHPNQVKIIQQCFMPSDSEIETAQKIVAATSKSNKGAIQVDGRLVDRPVILAAQKILDLVKNK